MLPNSNSLICGENYTSLRPYSELFKVQIVPFCFRRTSNSSFLYSNVKDSMTTNLIEARVDSQGKITSKTVEEFLGIYEYSCYGDDHVLLMNSEGDITLYNYHSKESYFLQKQHPSNFSPIQVHNIDFTFITCGGNVKTSANNQKIIKVWQEKEGQIVNSSRIITGHTKSIQNSFVLGRNKIVSLSTDRTVRCTNLATQQVESITHVSSDYYSGCPLDWTTSLLAGTAKRLDILDSRASKIAFSFEMSTLPVIQICQMKRITANNYIIANANQIWMLDIRNMQIKKEGYYEGQRITNFTVLSKESLVIGNRDKTLQIWNFQ